ncbi:DUF1905 domain-containing protein [Ulvibacterium sp.]|uniref:DUF1905 domain-containing protein n=1 Tax=Ulvibacterium sp. TaxID=2665914 RepID=UPI002604F610|nr:DUF1905 domain-containing protein [Ulvibacterium sp.]
MTKHHGRQTIKQLEKRKGGYHYIRISSSIIDSFERKRKTRLICTLDSMISYRCGLNHLGDGNYFIIISGKYLKELGKGLGEEVTWKIEEDPDPLGVEIPEVLAVFLTQDTHANEIFQKLTDGKKRSLIYSIIKIKDFDSQVRTIIDFLEEQSRRMGSAR